MKKILPRLALLAAPFLVYFALFFAFEPYDYFGVKGGASSEDSVITRVRAYLSAPEDAIILGDSRMAHFDMNAVAEASGRGWSNLAFGGRFAEREHRPVLPRRRKQPQPEHLLFRRQLLHPACRRFPQPHGGHRAPW